MLTNVAHLVELSATQRAGTALLIEKKPKVPPGLISPEKGGTRSSTEESSSGRTAIVYNNAWRIKLQGPRAANIRKKFPTGSPGTPGRFPADAPKGGTDLGPSKSCGTPYRWARAIATRRYTVPKTLSPERPFGRGRK